MKSPKSNAEIQITAAIIQMESLTQAQDIKISDAQYMIEMACKILDKCKELRESRDKWSVRAKVAEQKLKELKL